MFPLLEKKNKPLALGYIGFRVAEFTIFIVSAIGLLSLLTLSQEFVNAGSPDASSYQTLGTLLLAQRYWAFKMVAIFTGLGGLMFSYLLYQSVLVPRFISIWGLIGYGMLLSAVMLEVFGFDNFSFTVFFPGTIFYLPGGLFEILLPIWLFAKGFNSSATASESI